ncbi:ADP-ribosyl cyclase/cyclic ADP-ribose hydrolase 1-like [Gouania willdenowi]|uniref:ADP-ribosyl cyclase/cyclic ADP-ribose hydrolase n=1 Tax=Gouania willdenowi TaxID=441366 RepID=A0A8C5HY39_GOUWI|nr:ADP-ribosyl cyclase/cyclic ADP-ribose hydrolase 1-like [Gouania willdenowi]
MDNWWKKRVFVGVIVLGLCLGLGLGPDRRIPDFTRTFLTRCKKFSGNNCHELWDAFQQAYVNKDPCKVPMEAYDPLIAAAPLKSQCNKMLFWSNTKDAPHYFTKKKENCFINLEDTLLGFVLDDLIWCGKKGSSDTFTTGCPNNNNCVNNPVHSFWKRASAAFAEAACGAVPVMVSGSITTPFHPASIFASVEVKRFKAPIVTNLTVVLVTEKHNVARCTDPSLKDLRKELDKGIQYNCKEVPRSEIEACSSNPNITCGTCW